MRKKILFFHFDLGNGGAENVLVNLLNNLDTEKFDITLLLLFNHGVKLSSLSAHIHLKYVFNFKPKSGISQFLKLFSPKWLHKCFIRDKYDVEIAFLESIPTRIIGGCRNQDTKRYAWVHTSFADKQKFLHAYRSESEMMRCYRNMDGVAFVSQTALNTFQQLTFWKKDNLKVVNNVLEVDTIINNSKKTCSLPNGNKVNFCSVGRLFYIKAYDRLIRVLGTLYKEGVRDWHFYLLGQGEERENLERLTSDLNLKDNITFVGYDNNPHRYVTKMDFFVCSSLTEGYSTSVTESVILHTPVITTDCSGMSEIFGDSGCGMIVENSEEGLLNGMRQMLTEPDLVKKMRQCAIERSKFFSKERCIQQFETFIES